MLADCFGIQIHPAIPWILAIAAAARWLVTAGSMAYERVITARAVRERSRRDADLAEAKHRDSQVALMMDTVRRDHGWTFGFGPASPTSRERGDDK